MGTEYGLDIDRGVRRGRGASNDGEPGYTRRKGWNIRRVRIHSEPKHRLRYSCVVWNAELRGIFTLAGYLNATISKASPGSPVTNTSTWTRSKQKILSSDFMSLPCSSLSSPWLAFRLPSWKSRWETRGLSLPPVTPVRIFPARERRIGRVRRSARGFAWLGLGRHVTVCFEVVWHMRPPRGEVDWSGTNLKPQAEGKKRSRLSFGGFASEYAFLRFHRSESSTDP